MKKSKLITLSLIFSTLVLTGCSGKAPYIGPNGNWWIGEEDTGEPATGPKGEDGASVTVVSVEKTGTNGNVDTYTITFSDGTTTTFTVTNGADGECVVVTSITKTSSEGNVDTYTILFSNGSSYTFAVTNGKDGECVVITSITKTGSEGKVDTYTIQLSNGTSFTFTVTNGEDGLTPYIGPNGNWWIGDEDTGVFAEYNYETRDITDGLIFTPMTLYGRSGYVVTDFLPKVAFGTEKYNLLINNPETYASQYGIINIPDYIGTTPVIGFMTEAFQDVEYIGKISLSRNTIGIGAYTFEGCSNLKEVDLNGATIEIIEDRAFYDCCLETIELPEGLKTIGKSAFRGSPLKQIAFPDTLEKIDDYAFYGNKIESIDVNNVKYFGKYSLYGVGPKPIYLTKNVEYVGEEAFSGAYVFVEHETLPSNWDTNICGDYELVGKVTTNCLKNEEYIYTKTSSEVTIHDYIGDKTTLEIANQIDGLPVTKIGYGFNSVSNYLVNGLDAPRRLYSVRIPNTVFEIEYGAFNNALCTVVYVPKNVRGISVYVGAFGNAGLKYHNTRLLFESNTYPIFFDVNGDDLGDETAEFIAEMETNGWFIRNVEWENLYFDEENQSFYLEDDYGLSLLAYYNFNLSDSIIVKSLVNGKTVHTIRTRAFYYLEFSGPILIEDGIKKIQSYAFYELDGITSVYIPSSVTTINAYGFATVCNKFYTSHYSKPAEWDTLWTGYRYTYQYTVTYNYSPDSN